MRLAQIAANRLPSADVSQLLGRVKVLEGIPVNSMYDADSVRAVA